VPRTFRLASVHLLIASHALPWHRAGGLERATWMAAQGLAHRGHRVSILTTRPCTLPAASGIPNLTITELQGRPGHPSPAFWRDVARHVAHAWRDTSTRPDLLLAVDTAAMFLRGVPFLLQLHGTLFSETTLHRGFRPFRAQFPWLSGLLRYKGRVLAAPFFGSMLRRASATITDSEFITRQLLSARGTSTQRIHQIPLALEPAWAERLVASQPTAVEPPARFSPSRPLRLLTVGRIARIKGHEVVAQAIESLGRRLGPEQAGAILWRIAGPHSDVAGDLPSGLLRTPNPASPSANPADRPRIEVLGRLDDDALAREFGQADYLLNLEYNQPAFGLVPLEAMTAGCPAIVSDRGALPEILGHLPTDGSATPGFILPAGNAPVLADLLAQLFTEGPTAARQHSAAASRRAADFSFDRYITAIEAALAAQTTPPQFLT